MFRQILDLLKTSEPALKPGNDLRMAVAILMLEAAKMDDTFSAPERAAIERLLSEKFDLTPSEAHELLAGSEERLKTLVQLHPYTNTCFSQMNEGERIRLIEMLWEVVYADGVLDPEEDLLMRRIAGLVHVSDRDRIFARQRALARLKSDM